MKVTYPLYKTRKGVTVDLNHIIDNTRYFRRHPGEFHKFDSSVYCIIDPNGNIVYYGKGKFNICDVLHSRACSHKGDLLDKYLTKGWIIRLIAIGITDKEARALEALLIRKDGRALTKYGAKTWDEVSLINKRFEHEGEKLIKYHLIYGNNTRIAA